MPTQGAQPEKILEIRGEDWFKGLSYQSGLPYGGIFQSATNFDPFGAVGRMKPTTTPVQDTGTPVASNIRYMASGQESGTNYIYSWADTGGTPSLWRTNLNTGATTDQSSTITATSSSARGLIVYGGYLIYARETEIKSVILPGLGTNEQILTTGVTTGLEHVFTIGADLNIYFTNGNSIGKLINGTGFRNAGIASNSATYFSLEAGMTIRHLVNDGRYLVIIADNAGASTAGGKVNCMIGFWDYTSTTLTQRFDFQETGLVGGVFMDGAIYVFGKNYLYVTNISTFPKSIFSFTTGSTITTAPTSPAQISQQGNSILWASGTGIYGYGSLISGSKKIFYNPYTFPASVTAFMSMILAGGLFVYGGTTGSKLYNTLSGSTAIASIVTSQVPLPQPFRFDWAKIVTRLPLSSGESITFSVNSQAGVGAITGDSTFSYANQSEKQTYIFGPSGGGSAKKYFEEFYMTLLSNTSIERIELWGTRLDSKQQEL